MQFRYVVPVTAFCFALVASTAFGLRCYRCEDSNDYCSMREKLAPAQTCLKSDGKCFKFVVDLGAGHRVFHRGCTEGAHPDTYCKTEAPRYVQGGSLEYCGVCEGDECNGSSILSPYNLLAALLPCLLAYFFSK